MAFDGTLRVTPETMLNTSTQFGDCNNAIQGLTQQMLDIVGTLSSTWEGEAAKSYYDRLKALEPDMRKIHSMIQEHTNDLELIAKTFQDAERDNAATAGSLPTAGLA